MAARTPADWSELLEAIARLTGDDYDLIRFRAVCSSWRTAGKRVHVEERCGGGGSAGAHDVPVRRALRVRPLHVRAGHVAVRPGGQEGQLLLRPGLRLHLLRRNRLIDPRRCIHRPETQLAGS
ncbi:hypothetical protein EJB05_23565, partial [Eragrostis curvula]